MTARLTPDQARAAFKLLHLRTILFILTLPFGRGVALPCAWAASMI